MVVGEIMEIDKLIEYIKNSKKQYFLVAQEYQLLVDFKTFEEVMAYIKKKGSILPKKFFLTLSLCNILICFMSFIKKN